MSAFDDLELQLKGLVLVRTVIELRGADDHDIDTYTQEIERVRTRLAGLGVDAKGGGARSAAA